MTFTRRVTTRSMSKNPDQSINNSSSTHASSSKEQQSKPLLTVKGNMDIDVTEIEPGVEAYTFFIEDTRRQSPIPTRNTQTQSPIGFAAEDDVASVEDNKIIQSTPAKKDKGKQCQTFN